MLISLTLGAGAGNAAGLCIWFVAVGEDGVLHPAKSDEIYAQDGG